MKVDPDRSESRLAGRNLHDEVHHELDAAVENMRTWWWHHGRVVGFTGWEEGSILEAATWRPTSKLTHRHPATMRLFRTHPEGTYDCSQR